jgi:hypothetical protein
MCVYSMVADHWRDKWTPYPQPSNIPIVPSSPFPNFPVQPGIIVTVPTPDEVEAFRRDAAELTKILKRAKEYDEKNGEPACELDSKKEALQKIADAFGIEIEFP